MVAELKNYQSQVHAYRFENERLDKTVSDMKQMYFNHKRKGTLGIIAEMDEDEMQMQDDEAQEMM